MSAVITSLPPSNKPVISPKPTLETSHGSLDDDASNESFGILSQALELATSNIFGLYALEVWRYDEVSGNLENVPLARSHDLETGLSGKRGMLVKRVTQEADPTSFHARSEAVDAFRMLTDPSQKDFIAPQTTGPGVGLPGILWSEIDHNQIQIVHGASDSIVWRRLDVLANDPDQAVCERLRATARAGFDLAAGVSFDINGYRGLVIFFGNPHADSKKLMNPINSRFINHAAHLIGAAVAIESPLKKVSEFNEKIKYDNWHRLKVKVLTIVRFGGTLRPREKSQSPTLGERKISRRRSSIVRIREASSRLRNNFKQTMIEAKDHCEAKAFRWWKKVQGGNAGIPPRHTTVQCLWTFLGLIVTHTILSRLNLFITTVTENDLSLLLPPLGALTTLQYSLTPAPAAQPRNAIFSQIFGITVAMLVSYIPKMPVWFRSALAPTIVTTGMGWLGVVHPPAGAAAVLFSSGKFGWDHMGVFLAGVCISITTAVIINNMSDKRQYPTSWPLINKAKNYLSGSE